MPRKGRWGETSLQASLVRQFRLWVPPSHGVIYCVPNGEKLSPQAARRLLEMGLLPGVSDLVILLRGGRSIYAEVKTKDGRQSPPQRDFQTNLAALGHRYVVLRSVDDLTELLVQEGLVARHGAALRLLARLDLAVPQPPVIIGSGH